MFTSSQKNTAFRSINAYENRYEMQICILRPEKARFSHPVIARNRCREHAQHAPLMKGRSSGSGIIIVSRLPGSPVAAHPRMTLHSLFTVTRSYGTARALHPFPYYPARLGRQAPLHIILLSFSYYITEIRRKQSFLLPFAFSLAAAVTVSSPGADTSNGKNYFLSANTSSSQSRIVFIANI